MRGSAQLFDSPGRGGVNLLDAPYELKDYEARDARNVVSTVRGAVKKRDGSVNVVTVGTTLTSLFASPLPLLMIAAGGTQLYSITAAGVSSVIKTGLTSGLRWEFVNAPASGGQGAIWGMNGTDTPQQWDGAAGTTSAWTAATGTLPNGKFLLYAGRRVFVAGMSAYGGLADAPSALVSSNLGDPRDWPVANVNQFDPNDGDAITGLGTIGPYVLVFKSGKAWVVYDLDTLANRPLGNAAGCVAHRSIVETPQGTFFLSKDHGVMLTDGSAVKRVSDRVLPLIQSMSQAQRAAACGAYFNDHYLLSFSTGGVYNDVMLDYDVKADVWWIHSIGVSDLALWEPSGIPALYSVRSNTGSIDRIFATGALTDAGSTFAAYWNGPYHVFRQPALRKRCRQLRFDGNGRVQVSISKDFRRGSDLWLDQTFAVDPSFYGVNDTDPASSFGVNDAIVQLYGGTFDVAMAKVPTPGVARAWSIMFGNATNDAFTVESYTMAMQQRKD